MTISEPYISRFKRRVLVAGCGDCWEWQAAIGSHGYGAMGVGGRDIALAHRIAWELDNGAIPDGLLVLHKCDNRRCCNPAHLFLGTNKDNSDDKWRKGRANVLRHDTHARAKLSSRQVREIRAKYIPYVYTQAKLAAEYGVSRSQIRNITLGVDWVGV